jgi:hypothetical protein
MAATVLGAGFKVDPAKAKLGSGDKPDESEPIGSVEEELARIVVARLRTGFPAAAMAAAVELTESIASKYGLQGGAWL